MKHVIQEFTKKLIQHLSEKKVRLKCITQNLVGTFFLVSFRSRRKLAWHVRQPSQNVSSRKSIVKLIFFAEEKKKTCHSECVKNPR